MPQLLRDNGQPAIGIWREKRSAIPCLALSLSSNEKATAWRDILNFQIRRQWINTIHMAYNCFWTQAWAIVYWNHPFQSLCDFCKWFFISFTLYMVLVTSPSAINNRTKWSSKMFFVICKLMLSVNWSIHNNLFSNSKHRIFIKFWARVWGRSGKHVRQTWRL